MARGDADRFFQNRFCCFREIFFNLVMHTFPPAGTASTSWEIGAEKCVLKISHLPQISANQHYAKDANTQGAIVQKAADFPTAAATVGKNVDIFFVAFIKNSYITCDKTALCAESLWLKSAIYTLEEACASARRAFALRNSGNSCKYFFQFLCTNFG
ncbi:MAG: hypothetical protein IJ760_08055 [Bacteroidales bacterium]|nr:hypothetical protein [Bacteroidales bacterium]